MHGDERPAEPEDIAEAREEYGVDVPDGVSNAELERLVSKAVESEERFEGNRERIAKLKRRGFSVDRTTPDARIDDLEYLLISLEMGQSDARQYGITKPMLPKADTESEMRALSATLERFNKTIPHVLEVDFERYGVVRVTKKLERELSEAWLQELLARPDERTPDPETWTAGQLASRFPVTVDQPRPRRSVPRPPTPRADESDISMLVGVVGVLLAVIAAVIIATQSP